MMNDENTMNAPTMSEPRRKPAALEKECYLLVESGVSTGATFTLHKQQTLLCGNGFENDIIIAATDDNDWKISVCRQRNVVHLRVLSGSVTLDGNEVARGEETIVREDTLVNCGNSSFSLNIPHKSTLLTSPADISEKGNSLVAQLSGKSANVTRNLLYGFSIMCVVIGVTSAMYAITGSLILVNADTNASNSNFMEMLEASEISHLDVTRVEGTNRYIVKGTLSTREQKILLQQLAKDTGAELDLDIRVNDLIRESVEDVFRVNGLAASTKMMPDGEVRIFTNTGDLEKLEELRQKVRSDLPLLTRFEIVNKVPPVKKPKNNTGYKPLPEKRITLIAAGDNAYIMTQDKSRYFVGALLPSGHLVEAINDGEVIVSKNGKTDRLSY